MASNSGDLIFEGPLSEFEVHDEGVLIYTAYFQEELVLHWEQNYDSAENTSSLTLTGYLSGVRADQASFDGTEHWVDGILTVNGVDVAIFDAHSGTQYALIGGPQNPSPITNGGIATPWTVTINGLQHDSHGDCTVTVSIKRNAGGSFGGTGFCNTLGRYYNPVVGQYWVYNFGAMSDSIELQGTPQPVAEECVFLDTGSGFQSYTVWIDTGSGWVQAVPYLDTGSEWVLCGREVSI